MTFIPTRTTLTQARREIDGGEIDKACETLSPFVGDAAVEIPARENARSFWRDAAAALRDAGLAAASERAWNRARDHGLPARVAAAQSALAYLVAGEFGTALERVESLDAKVAGANPVLSSARAIALFETRRRSEAVAQWERLGQADHRPLCPFVTHPLHLALSAMAIERFLMGESRTGVSPVDPGQDARAAIDRRDACPTLFGQDAHATQKAPGSSRKRRLAEVERALDEGENARALAWLEAEGADARKADDYAVTLYAAALGENGRWAEARETAAEILEKNPSSPSAQAFYASCLVQSGEPAIALAVLDRVAPAGPDDYCVNYLRGVACLALDDRPRALAALRVAFTRYFFDTFHGVLIPGWRKVARVASCELRVAR